MPNPNPRCGPRGLLTVLALLCAGDVTSADTGFVPSSDVQVVEELPQAWLDFRPKHVRAAPRPTLDAAVDQARRLISAGRQSGDLRFYGYAQAKLAPWWEKERPPNPVLLLRALVRQAGHDFAGALSDLDLLLKRAPEHAQAWLSRAMILLTQGEPQAALRSCGHLIGEVDDLIGAACITAANPSEQTLELLGKTLERPAGQDEQVRIWALRIQAEAAERLGKKQLAAEAFREAMTLDPGDVGLLAQYSAFLLREGRAEVVVDLLQGEAKSTTLLLRLAQAARLTKHPEAAAYAVRLQDQLAAEALRGQTLHLREAARAQLDLLDAPQRALETAVENWSSQREPADAHLLLEAALQTNQPQAAAPVLQWARDHRIADARLAKLIAALGEPHHAPL